MCALRVEGKTGKLEDVFVAAGKLIETPVGQFPTKGQDTFEVATCGSYVAISSYAITAANNSSLRIYHLFLGHWTSVAILAGLDNDRFGWTGPGSLCVQFPQGAKHPYVRTPGVEVTYKFEERDVHKSWFQTPEETATYKWFWKASEANGAKHAFNGFDGYLPPRSEYGMSSFSPDNIGRNYLRRRCHCDGHTGALYCTYKGKTGIAFFRDGDIVHFEDHSAPNYPAPALASLHSFVAILDRLANSRIGITAYWTRERIDCSEQSSARDSVKQSLRIQPCSIKQDTVSVWA